VQGNIPQDEKWDRRFTDVILSKYEDLTKKAFLEKADLAIWPETSIPGFVENEENLFSAVKELVTSVNAPLLAGAPRYTDAKSGASYYNSAFLFLKDGNIGGYYDKIHLVPFGEYVPFKELLSFVHRFAPRPIGDCAAGKDFTVFRFLLERAVKNEDYSWKLSKKVGFSCLICFEDIFPDLARRFAAKNADFLVNITNDAWFGKSSAAYQHVQASIFRAVENRINVLRAANTGLSCFIDQKGRIAAKVMESGKDLFVDGFKVHEIVLSRVRTVYTVYGDIFAYICIFFTVFNITRRLREGNTGGF
jgi:apolipoprotein N-acyltransferase